MASQSSQQSLWWEYQVLLYLLITDKKTEVGRIQWASQVIPLKNGEGGLLPLFWRQNLYFLQLCSQNRTISGLS